MHQWISVKSEEVGVRLVIRQPAVSAQHTTLTHYHLHMGRCRLSTFQVFVMFLLNFRIIGESALTGIRHNSMDSTFNSSYDLVCIGCGWLQWANHYLINRPGLAAVQLLLLPPLPLPLPLPLLLVELMGFWDASEMTYIVSSGALNSTPTNDGALRW